MRRHSYLRAGAINSQNGSSGGTVVVVPGEDSVWSCDPGLPLNSLVYISSSNTVAEADGSSQDTMTSIGFVSSKSGSSCSVHSAGELAGFEGLIPGRTYYAGKEPGTIWTPTEEDETFPLVVQVVGKAKTEEVLLVMINPGPFILFPPISP
jgi:hypothetical protein